jgi:transglutaminase-like putative cysteine protease
MLIRISTPIILCTLLFLLTTCSIKQETKEEKKTTGRRVTIAEIEAGITHFIRRKTEQNDGYFSVRDRGEEFRMKLVRVHTEYLASLGANSHFACVDLADERGDVYDVDFFLEGKPGAMNVTETSIHKLNGKPFYAWKQRPDKTWNRVPVKEAGTRLLGVIEGSDSFEFTYRVDMPEINGVAKMWIPIATSDEHQTVEITAMNIPMEYTFLHDKEFSNTIVFLQPLASHSRRAIEITYKVKRLEKGPVVASGPIEAKYLKENRLMPVGGRFETIAKEITLRRNETELMKARALYDYIIDNMRYMKFGKYGNGDANYACDVRTGNCTEFHSFFISLARSLGIPARFAVGASIPSERNEGGIDGYHCWAEFYAEGKWWPVDISEANKYTALATYYFGHHPANRIELSRGRDLQVEPGPASGPINFLAHPLLEINGKEVMAKTTFTFNRPVTPSL